MTCVQIIECDEGMRRYLSLRREVLPLIVSRADERNLLTIGRPDRIVVDSKGDEKRRSVIYD